MPKVKVVFLMHHLITGGIETCLLQILELLKDNDKYEVSVISRVKVTEKRFLHFFQNNNVNLLDNGFFYHMQPRPTKYLQKKIWRLRKRIEKIRFRRQLRQYDIIIDYFNGCFCNLIKKVNRPKIAFLHCSISAYFSNPEYMKNIESYHKIVAISQSFYNDFVIKHPELANKIECIYNPVDVISIQNRVEQGQMSELPHKYFVSVARLHTDKDHETLIRGFKLFLENENCPDVKLYLCGDGPLRQQWEELTDQLHLDNHVVFFGNVPNPFAYVKGALAHILSSFGEGLPTVLIEAQALNTLNIASNVKSGVAEILMNGEAGLLFKPQNPNDLAVKMSQVYHNQINIDKMKSIALQNLDRFNPYVVLDQITALVQNLYNTKRG